MNRRCTACKPGVRCDRCREVGFATVRMLSVPTRFHGDIKRLNSPVEWADQQTSYHDARAALCFALGVPIDLIHPVTGHDLSRHVPTT